MLTLNSGALFINFNKKGALLINGAVFHNGLVIINAHKSYEQSFLNLVFFFSGKLKFVGAGV